MSKRFWAVSAALALLGTAGGALAAAPQPQALPDFPPDAEPGACYARIRDGGPGDAGPGKGVWTLKRGHGPEAVWSYSEPGPAPRPGASADGYRWVRVLCEDGRTPFTGEAFAHGGPATGTTGAGLAPLPPLASPPPPAPPPPPSPPLPRHEPPAAHPHHAAPFHHPLPPVHAAPPARRPEVFFFPAPGPVGPEPQFGAFPPPPPPPLASPPRWFGDRYLHWAGKRAPVW